MRHNRSAGGSETDADKKAARTQANRFARAKVNGANGLLIFPDGYNGTTEVSGIDGIAEVNTQNAAFPTSSIESSTWTMMENDGCVFLPAAGRRYGSDVSNVCDNWNYRTSTPENLSNAIGVFISSKYFFVSSGEARSIGSSVRLVIAAQ